MTLRRKIPLPPLTPPPRRRRGRFPHPREAQERAPCPAEIETRRLWCGLNLFWTDCGADCRRAHACLAADPRACFAHRWNALGEGDKAFRRDFIRAFARLRDRDEAMVEAIARALLRREENGSAA